MAPTHSASSEEARPSTRPGHAGKGGLQMASHLAAQKAVWADTPAQAHAVLPLPLCAGGPGGGALGQSQGSLSPPQTSGSHLGTLARSESATWPQGPGWTVECLEECGQGVEGGARWAVRTGTPPQMRPDS